MDERVLQFRVGVVVLSAALITGILVFIFGEGWKPRYQVSMDFQSAPGVSPNTPVRKNGILIGRVTSVELQEDGVRLTARIDRDIKLYTNEICRINNSLLMGDAVLEFVPGRQEERGDLVQDGAVIQFTEVAPDPQARVNEAVANVVELKEAVEVTLATFNEETLPTFNRTMEQFGMAGENIASITAMVNDALQGETGNLRQFFDDIRRLTATTNEAVRRFESVMGHVEEVVGDDRIKGDIKETLAGLPSIVQKAEMTLDEAQVSMEAFQNAAISAEENLDNLQGFTGPLRDNGEQMVADLQRSLQSVSEMAIQLEEFTSALNASEGTVGLLLNDPQLYYSLLEAIDNVELITREFRPIVRDLRVAADKIARDPGQLGVRGALDRRPVGSGVKGGLWQPTTER